MNSTASLSVVAPAYVASSGQLAVTKNIRASRSSSAFLSALGLHTTSLAAGCSVRAMFSHPVSSTCSVSADMQWDIPAVAVVSAPFAVSAFGVLTALGVRSSSGSAAMVVSAGVTSSTTTGASMYVTQTIPSGLVGLLLQIYWFILAFLRNLGVLR